MPTFQQIYSQYNSARDKNLIGPDESISDYAKKALAFTGDPSYQSVAEGGTVGNWVRQRSADLTGFVNSGPVDEWLGEGTKFVGDMFGIDPAASRSVGESLPRMAVDYLPLAASAALAPFTGGASLAVGAAGLAGTSALSAASGYEQSGQLSDAIIGGAAPYVGGKLSEIGGKAALSLVPKSQILQRLGFTGGTQVTGRALTAAEQAGMVANRGVTDAVAKATTKSFTELDKPLDKLLHYVGGEALANVGFTGLDIAQQGTDAVFNRDYLFANLVSNVPFAAADLAGSFANRPLGEVKYNLPTAPKVYESPGEQRAVEAAAMFQDLKDPVAFEQQRKKYGLDIADISMKTEELAAALNAKEIGLRVNETDFISKWNNYVTNNPEAQSAQFPTIKRGGAFGSELLGMKEVLGMQSLPIKAQEIVAGFKKQNNQLKAQVDGVVKNLGSPVKYTESLKVAVEKLNLDEFLQTPLEQRDYATALKGSWVSLDGADLVRDIHRKDAGLEPLRPDLYQEFVNLFKGEPATFTPDKHMELLVAASLARGKTPKFAEAKKKSQEAVEEGQPDEVVVKEALKGMEEENKEVLAPFRQPVIPEDFQSGLEDTGALPPVDLIAGLPKKPAVASVSPRQTPVAEANPVVEQAPQVQQTISERLIASIPAKWDRVRDVVADFYRTGDDTQLQNIGIDEASMRIKTIATRNLETADPAYKQRIVEWNKAQAKAGAERQKILNTLPVKVETLTPDMQEVLRNNRVDQQKIPTEYLRAENWSRVKDQDGNEYLIPMPDGEFQRAEDFARTLMKEYVSPEMLPESSKQLVSLAKMLGNPELWYAKLKEMVKGKSDALFARASAGTFDFGMREVQGGKLIRPGKPPLGTKDGWMTELEFRVNGGDLGPLQKDEVAFYKQLVPEAFAGDKVHLQKLWDGLGKVGEQVKVVTYGQDGDASPAKVELDRVNGELDILDYEWQEKYVSGFEKDSQGRTTQAILKAETPENIRALVERRNKANDLYRAPAQELPKATSYYNTISPFDTKKFPVLRVDVVLPLSAKTQDAINRGVDSLGREREIKWRQDNLHENLPNTLGWAMVQIVPHPVTGEKVMFVGEAQSRWGQEEAKLQKRAKEELVKAKAAFDKIINSPNSTKDDKIRASMVLGGAQRGVDNPQGHPLLPIHQNLILKAVIKEAQKQGISKVAVSDGETAMMTEGHDKAAKTESVNGIYTEARLKEVPVIIRKTKQPTSFTGNVKYESNYSGPSVFYETSDGYFSQDDLDFPEIRRFTAISFGIVGRLVPTVKIVSQEGGMRLAYDTTMPSIMKKLVGEGKVEDFGVHKNAQKEETFDEVRAREAAGWSSEAGFPSLTPETKLVGSPVFRTPSGTPKTNATARVFDISNPSDRVNTLFARKPVPGGQVYAAAIEAKRQIFLNPKALEGLSPLDRVRVQASLLAHESSHILIHKARNGLFGSEVKAIIDNMDLWASSANPHEIEVVVDTLADVFLDKRTRELPGVADVIKNLRDNSGRMDKDEVLANIYGIWATGLHQLKDPGRFYTFMPKVVRDVYDWIAGKIQGVVRAAQMYVRFGGDQEKLKRVQQVRDVFAAVRKGARQAEENLGELNQLVNLSQTDVFDLADAKFAAGEYGSTGKPGASFMNKIDSWVVRMGSLAATHQGLEKPFRAMVDTMPLIHDIIAQSYAGLGWGDYSYTGLNVKKNSGPARIRDSESLNNTLNKVNVEVQRLMETAVVKNPDGTVEFDLQKLSPELRAEVKQYNPEAQRVLAEYVIKRSEQTMPIVHGTIVAKEWDKQTDNLHKILFRYESMKMDYKLAEQVAYESMQAVRQGDMVKLAEVLKKVPSPVEAAQIGKFVTAMGQRIKNLEADYKKNPAFGSLRRFQPIKQTWTKTGFPDYKMQARNAKDAEAQSARLESEGWTPGIPRIEDFKPTDEWVMDSNSKKRLIDMETRLHESLDELGIPEDVKAELKKDMNFVAMLEEDAAGQSVYSTKVRREFAEGTDRLNALEQDLTFIHAAISGSMKRALDAKVSVAMLNPELNTVKDAKDVFQQGYENFNQSNNPWLSKLSKANAAWFIGMNIPGHVAELLQPVMTHLAEMRNIGLRTGKALGVIMSSNKDITAFYKRNAKKFATGETVHLWDDWKDAEEREMLFEHKHVINANPLNYAFDEMGFQQQQLIAMTDGGKKKSLSELALSPATAYANWSLKFYNLFTRHNAIMGLVGGYRAYRQAGYSHAEAKEKVRLYEVVVNKSGGRADRQAAPFKGNAVLGHLFYGLQGYTTGWFSQALTYARHGYNSKDYIGFKDNPVAAKNARSALHTMLGAQLAASGLIGLPFVGALMTLWEEMMGEDVRGKLYENLEEVTGDPLLAQAASHGVASALAEKLGIPADLHGRFAIGGFLGFNAYDGFSAASLLGPTAGMINGMWKMGESLTQEHDVRKALASGGPTGIRNIAKALDQELPASGDSQLGTAFGFRSTQARKEIEFERIAKMRNEKAAREISHAARRVQENLGRGSAVVQQIVMAEAKKLVETESPQELKQVVSKIGSKVRQYEEEKRFPQDLREVGSTGQSAQLGNLARSMGVQLPQSQEVAREVMKSQLYQMMGMPYRSRVKDALQRDLATEREPWQMR